VTVDGAKYTLQAGDALFLFPHQIHSMESTESEHMLCIFSPQLVHAFAKKTAGLCPKENTFAVSPAVAAAVEATEDGSLFAGCNSCMMCKRVLLNAGIETLVVRDTPTEYRVIRVADWIEDDDSLTGKFGY